MSASASTDTSNNPWIGIYQGLSTNFFNQGEPSREHSITVKGKITNAIEKGIANLTALYNLSERAPNTTNLIATYTITRSKKTSIIQTDSGFKISINRKEILTCTIKPWNNRILPESISNDCDEGKIIDPISLDGYPLSEIQGPKFVHLGPYIFSAASLIKRLLTDTANYRNGIRHPLESRLLTTEEYDQVKGQLYRILTPKLAERLFPTDNASLINPSPYIPEILTPRIKIVLLFRKRLSYELLDRLMIGGWIESSLMSTTIVSFPGITFHGSPLQVSIKKVLNLYIGRITQYNNDSDKTYLLDDYRAFQTKELIGSTSIHILDSNSEAVQ